MRHVEFEVRSRDQVDTTCRKLFVLLPKFFCVSFLTLILALVRVYACPYLRDVTIFSRPVRKVTRAVVSWKRTSKLGTNQVPRKTQMFLLSGALYKDLPARVDAIQDEANLLFSAITYIIPMIFSFSIRYAQVWDWNRCLVSGEIEYELLSNFCSVASRLTIWRTLLCCVCLAANVLNSILFHW